MKPKTLITAVLSAALLAVAYGSGRLSAEGTIEEALRLRVVESHGDARLYPLTLEAGAFVAGILALIRSYRRDGAGREIGAFWVLTAVTVWVNVARIPHLTPLSITVASMPPLVLQGSVHLLASGVRSLASGPGGETVSGSESDTSVEGAPEGESAPLQDARPALEEPKPREPKPREPKPVSKENREPKPKSRREGSLDMALVEETALRLAREGKTAKDLRAAFQDLGESTAYAKMSKARKILAALSEAEESYAAASA